MTCAKMKVFILVHEDGEPVLIYKNDDRLIACAHRSHAEHLAVIIAATDGVPLRIAEVESEPRIIARLFALDFSPR